MTDPIRSLRNPDWRSGRVGGRSHPLWSSRCSDDLGHHRRDLMALDAVTSLSIPGATLGGQVVTWQGDRFPSVFRHVVDSPYDSRAKPGLLAACLAPHRSLSGAAVSPLGCIPQTRRPKGSRPSSQGRRSVLLIPWMRFVAHAAADPSR